MVEAAATFRKSGFNDSDSAMLSKVAAMYQNVSDTAVSAEEAASSIVSQIRAFGQGADFGQTIIDAYNEVANNFSIGTNDISQAMEIASAGLATYGNSFQETIGLVTAGGEIFQGRSAQVARGLSTIASNIIKSKDALKAYGIDVVDNIGNFKSTYEVLKELSKIWGDLTDAQRQALGESISGGVNQYKVLAAVMTNFQTAIDATNTALDSAGSAAEENAAYMESLEAQLNNLKGNFQDFANNVLSKDVVGALIETGDALIDFANTGVGTAATRILMLSGAVSGILGVFGQFAMNLKKMSDAFKGVSGISTLFAPKTILIITGVVAGIAALVEIIRAAKKAYDDAHPSLEQVNTDLESSQKQLADNKSKLDELNKISYAERSSDIALEIEQLTLANEQLEKYIKQLDTQKQKAAQKEFEGKHTVYTGEKEYTISYANQKFVVDAKNVGEAYELAAKKANEFYDSLAGLEGFSALTADSIETGANDISVAWSSTSQKGKQAVNTLIGVMQDYAENTKDGEEVTDEQRAAFEQNISVIQDLYEQTSYLTDEYKEQHPEIAQFIELYNKLLPVMEALTSNTDKLGNSLDKAGSEELDFSAESIKLHEKAVEVAGSMIEAATAVDTTSSSFMNLVAQEIIFNSTGLSTADKIKALSELRSCADDTAWSLSNVSQMVLLGVTEGEFEDEVNRVMGLGQRRGRKTTRDEAVRIVQKRLLTELQKQTTINSKESDTSTKYTGGGGGNTVTDTQLEALEAAVEYYKQMYQFAEASGQATSVQVGYLKDVQAALHAQAEYMRSQLAEGQGDTTEIVAISTEWWTIQNQINDLLKDTTEQIDEQKQALEDTVDAIQSEIDALETQRKVVQGQLDDITNEKDELEKIISYISAYSDKQIDSIQAEIDAIDAAADAINEKYDAQIAALEKTNSELDKEIKRQQLLANLAKAQAKQVLVYRDGRFVYEQDIPEVTKAQTALDEFDKEQLVKKEKELIEQNRENELKYNNQEKAALEAEKKRWEEYRNGWNNLASDYEYSQNEILAIQKYGINLEKSNWDSRLSNFNDFVNKYADVMGRYTDIQNNLQQIEEDISARQDKLNEAQNNLNNYNNNTGDSKLPRVLKVNPDGNAPSNARIGDYIVTGGGIYQITGGTTGNWQSNRITGQGFSDLDIAKEWLASQGYVFQYARGTYGAHGGLSVVGENGPELRVLNSGDGVIPADATKNLWSWGAFSPMDLISKIGNLAHDVLDGSGTITYQFNIDNLSLPNAKDANGLLSGLRNYAYQVAYQRG